MKNKITLKQHISMLAWQLVVAIALMLVGATLSMAFFFTEDEFWANVMRFWR